MRFFTPELFIKFNSPNDEEADRADEAWEAALQEYRHHLDGLRDRIPSPVRKLAELCLHDAELLACDQSVEPISGFPSEPLPLWSGFAILTVKQGRKFINLIYILFYKIRKYQPIEAWPFSKLRTHWLYDEIDVAPSPRGMFLHRVLFSDGSVVEIPFVSALIHSIPLQATEEGDASGQGA